jgi:hypothetical protein
MVKPFAVGTHFRILLVTLLLSVFLGACEYHSDPTVTPDQTDCTAGEAQIQVSDGYFQILCGCVEPEGTITETPGTLNCTVKSGTVVFFLYLNTHLEHQIVSTGGVPFASGAPNNPGNSNNTNLAAQFTTVGTADFDDAFDTQLQGQIIITP